MQTEARVTVLVGLAVHAVVVARTETPATITSPRDLRPARLAAVTLALAQRKQLHTLQREPRIGPTTSPHDPVGLEQITELDTLYRTEILGWEAITQQAKAVGMWHLVAEDYRDEATLGERLATYEAQQKQATRVDRQSLLHAAALVHDEF